MDTIIQILTLQLSYNFIFDRHNDLLTLYESLNSTATIFIFFVQFLREAIKNKKYEILDTVQKGGGGDTVVLNF